MLAIGNQTSISAPVFTDPFDYAVANEFGAFEWFPDKHSGSGWDEADLDVTRRQELRNTAEERGVRLSVHARLNANPFEPESEAWFRDDIELAHDLGAEIINIHLNHERGMGAFVTAILPLLRWTDEAGLVLAIENTPLHSPEHFNELFTGLRASSDAPVGHVGMCFDLGHANLCPATRNRYLEFLDRLDAGVPIRHLHLHENWGDADSHLPLFTGPSASDEAGLRGVVERLRRRRFSGLAILEQWPHPPSLLNAARDRLIRIWNESEGKETSPIEAMPPVRAEPEAGPRSAGSQKRTKETKWNQETERGWEEGMKKEGSPAPTADLVAELTEADRRCRSWREKLEAVRLLLSRESPPLAPGQLVDLAIYLRFLGTGQIACSEDGRHFRPAHHARIAEQIRKRLADLTTPENAFVARRIYPWLPSSAPAFQRAEPLTRIRDLAHRNDIPADLKNEIKHSLQNKLHRCASPEDLAVSESLLARITTPGANYSPDFVEQFRVFHAELKEFFNARSLEDQLHALLPGAPREAGLIQTFLSQKSAPAVDTPALFRTLTELRLHFQPRLGSSPGPGWQELILADIALEDYAFVLLSQRMNTFDSAPAGWPALVETLFLAVENTGLSGIDPAEANAIASELRAWGAETLVEREPLLRLKATVERARRLAETHSQQVMALFAARAQRLGRALGVADHAIRVFGEAEVRSHLVFQLAKLSSYLARHLRVDLAQAGWDVLVSGRAAGYLRRVDGLDEPAGRPMEPALLAVRHAAGDEEVPTGVTGVVLAHELPHLSHLAVRARQAGVVLVTCEEPRLVAELEQASGAWIELTATADGVEWKPADPRASATAVGTRAIAIPKARLNPNRPTLPLAEATLENAGGKADGLRRLEHLARQPNALFKTIPAIVVPFGVMENALGSVPGLESEYRRWCASLDHRSADAQAVEGTLDHLRALVDRIPVPQAVLSAVASQFEPEARLMARSSANGEDLETMAGAGLYDSVANVAPDDVPSTVKKVWASLWTRRAALSRARAGIPHDAVHMAVILQPMIVPRLSFVLHTVNPVDRNPAEVYAEIVVGLGETLVAGAARGNPYRLVCAKHSGAVKTLAFANFSCALEPAPRGLASRVVDYSQIDLSRDTATRNALGKRLAAVGASVETAFGRPQDIEGAIVGDQLFLVQARPQQGI